MTFSYVLLCGFSYLPLTTLQHLSSSHLDCLFLLSKYFPFPILGMFLLYLLIVCVCEHTCAMVDVWRAAIEGEGGSDSLHLVEVKLLNMSAVLYIPGNSPVSASHVHHCIWLFVCLNVGSKTSLGFHGKVLYPLSCLATPSFHDICYEVFLNFICIFYHKQVFLFISI